MNNLPPLWLLKYLPNMPACHVTIIHGAGGPSNTITCAEASGLLSIGESMRVIERGDAEMCFAGGAESKINPVGLFRMSLAHRVGDTGDETDGGKIVRPYDETGGGGLLGEGGGILVIEERDYAKARGAETIYAEIAGFGAAQTPNPITPADESGALSVDREVDGGLKHAIERAIADAGIEPKDIDAIVPLGLGTTNFDSGEAGALRGVFGDRMREIPLVTIAPNIGNCCAGQAALTAVVGALCVKHQKIPARIHAGTTPDWINAGPSEAEDRELNHVLVCSGAMGGQNAAVVLRPAD